MKGVDGWMGGWIPKALILKALKPTHTFAVIVLLACHMCENFRKLPQANRSLEL